MIDTELLIIALPFIVVFILFFVLDWTNKSRLKRLKSIIDGRISRRFLRFWFHPCLTGNLHGQRVQIVLQRGLRFADFFIDMYVRCPSPSSTLIVLPYGHPISATVPASVYSKIFLHGHKFKIPEADILVIFDTGDEAQIRKYLNPSRTKLLEDIFSQGFNYFQIRQDIDSGCYIRAGYQYMNYGFYLIFKFKVDSVLNPETVHTVLTKLQDFLDSSAD